HFRKLRRNPPVSKGLPRLQRYSHALTSNLVFLSLFLISSSGFAAAQTPSAPTLPQSTQPQPDFQPFQAKLLNGPGSSAFPAAPLFNATAFQSSSANPDPGYHWTGLLVQSLEFNMFE